MKNLIRYLPLIIMTIIFSCSQPQKQANIENESLKKELKTDVNNSKLSLNGSYQKRIKEVIFFYLREKVINIGDNDFLQSEDLTVNDKMFEYTAKIYDRDLLYQVMKKNIIKASILQYDSKEEDDLSTYITIKGTFTLKANGSQIAIENESTSFIINLKAEYETSYISQSPYGYNDNRRVGDGFDFEEDLVVAINEPVIYTNETLYLKARIHELSGSDLAGLNKDELAYLRNEIFARHGHTFKTDKIIQYFINKTWYQPMYEDATNFLNETEKKNALFIRSLES